MVPKSGAVSGLHETTSTKKEKTSISEQGSSLDQRLLAKGACLNWGAIRRDLDISIWKLLLVMLPDSIFWRMMESGDSGVSPGEHGKPLEVGGGGKGGDSALQGPP